jgi:hypothetical protein
MAVQFDKEGEAVQEITIHRTNLAQRKIYVGPHAERAYPKLLKMLASNPDFKGIPVWDHNRLLIIPVDKTAKIDEKFIWKPGDVKITVVPPTFDKLDKDFADKVAKALRNQPSS